jgi:hypothetical protein
VAEREGIIKAQVEPVEGGKDQADAFKALRRHIEMALDRILSSVPGAAGLPQSGSPLAIAGPSARPSEPMSPQRPQRLIEPQSPGRESGAQDAPPAYGKAVKEWRSLDDSKR